MKSTPSYHQCPKSSVSNGVDAGYAGAVKTTEQMLAEARKAGVKVTVSTRPKGQGEITLLPGLRPKGSA